MSKEIARGMVCFFHQKKHSYLILIYPVRSDPSLFLPIFHCLILSAKLLIPYWLLPIISMDPPLSYIYCCTAHHSSVSFWTRKHLDQIKVITRAHPCHHFHSQFGLGGRAIPDVMSTFWCIHIYTYEWRHFDVRHFGLGQKNVAAPYIHTCIHGYVHAYTHSESCTYIHTYIHGERPIFGQVNNSLFVLAYTKGRSYLAVINLGNTIRPYTGWPDGVVKKITQNVAQLIFVKINGT
jgi:hypothetical protein